MDNLALTHDAEVWTRSGGPSRRLRVHGRRGKAEGRREMAQEQAPSPYTVPRLSRQSLAPSRPTDTEEGPSVHGRCRPPLRE